jgi:hypothetical protein
LATNATITIAPASFNPALNYLGESQYGADPLFNGQLDALFIYISYAPCGAFPRCRRLNSEYKTKMVGCTPRRAENN